MNAQEYWQLFLETGAPEMYLLYNKARTMEESNVFNSQGIGTQSDGIQ